MSSSVNFENVRRVLAQIRNKSPILNVIIFFLNMILLNQFKIRKIFIIKNIGGYKNESHPLYCVLQLLHFKFIILHFTLF